MFPNTQINFQKKKLYAFDSAQDYLYEASIFELTTTSANKPFVSSRIGATQTLTILEKPVLETEVIFWLYSWLMYCNTHTHKHGRGQF